MAAKIRFWFYFSGWEREGMGKANSFSLSSQGSRCVSLPIFGKRIKLCSNVKFC